MTLVYRESLLLTISTRKVNTQGDLIQYNNHMSTNLGANLILYRRGDFDVTGNATSFDPEVFAETRSFWKTDRITLRQAVEARQGRIITSKRTNPKHRLSPQGARLSAGETWAYLATLGDIKNLTAPKRFVEYFFENERLPTKLGWTKPKQRVNLKVLSAGITSVLQAAKPVESAMVGPKNGA